jgi:hypothetical protein
MPRGSAPGERRGGRANEQAQIAALNGILDRGYGKPTQAIVGDPKRPIVAVTVDRPPEETREQWLARRGQELAANTAVGAAATVNGRDHS